MQDRLEIQLWTEEPEDSVKSAIPSLARTVQRTVSVSAEMVAKNLSSLIQPFRDAFDETESTPGSLGIERIELNVVVNAAGGVELIGKVNEKPGDLSLLNSLAQFYNMKNDYGKSLEYSNRVLDVVKKLAVQSSQEVGS